MTAYCTSVRALKVDFHISDFSLLAVAHQRAFSFVLLNMHILSGVLFSAWNNFFFQENCKMHVKQSASALLPPTGTCPLSQEVILNW